MNNATKVHAPPDEMIPTAHTTPFHGAVGDGFLLMTGLGCIGLIVSRHVSWNYTVDEWTRFTPLVLLCMVSLWFVFLLAGAVKLSFRILCGSSSYSPHVLSSSARIILGGLWYCGCWMAWMLGLKLVQNNQIPVLFSASGVALTHVCLIVMYRRKLSWVCMNAVALSGALSLGLVLYLVPKSEWYFVADLTGAVSAILLAVLAGLARRGFITAGLVGISVSFWLGAFTDARIGTTIAFGLGMSGVLYGILGEARDEVTTLVAFLFGSWSRLRPPTDVEEPLLTSVSETV